ncbi:hypothetical protein ACVTNF_003436 [Photobacterium damselae]
MTEIMKIYNSNSINKKSLLPLSHEDFESPISSDVKWLRSYLGWSQRDLGCFLGLKVSIHGCNTVRKWEVKEGRKEHRNIHNGYWRLMVIASKLDCIETDIANGKK